MLKSSVRIVLLLFLVGYPIVAYLKMSKMPVLPMKQIYPHRLTYSNKCAPIVQEFLHLNAPTKLLPDRWELMMDRLDQCEHLNARTWIPTWSGETFDDKNSVRGDRAQNSSRSATAP